MAAAITTTATTLEGQLFEVVSAVQAAELAQPEASRPNRVTVAFDTEAETVAIGITFDVTMTRAGSNLTFAPVAYLP